MSTSYCRSCGAVIRWALTANGARMPVNAQSSHDGYLDLTWDDDAGALVARVVKQGSPEQALLVAQGKAFTAHHATCPDAKTWRKK